jgi:hypothetical protein
MDFSTGRFSTFLLDSCLRESIPCAKIAFYSPFLVFIGPVFRFYRLLRCEFSTARGVDHDAPKFLRAFQATDSNPGLRR